MNGEPIRSRAPDGPVQVARVNSGLPRGGAMAIMVLVLWLFTVGAGFYLLVTSNLGRARPAATTPAAEPATAPAESATVPAAAPAVTAVPTASVAASATPSSATPAPAAASASATQPAPAAPPVSK